MWLLVFLSSFSFAWDSKTQFQLQGQRYNLQSDLLSTSALDLRIDSENRKNFSQKSKINIHPLLDVDFLTRDKSESVFFDFKEFYYSYQGVSTGWTLGFYQIKNVGTDILNPFDVIQAKRYKDPLNPDRLSVPGLKWESDMGLEVYYIPSNRKSLLPGEHSVWWPRADRFPIKTAGSQLLLPNPVEYNIGNDFVVDNALDNNFGLRYKWSGSVLDFHLLYYNGINTVPEIVPDLNGTLISTTPVYVIQLTNPIVLHYYWKRAETIGLGGNLQLGEWILRAFGHHQSISSNIEDWWVSEIEHTFHIFSTDLTIILEMSRGWNHRNDDKQDLMTLSMIYYSADVLGLRYVLSETKNFMMGYLYDENFGGSLVNFQFNDSIRDNLNVFASGNFISGPAKSFYALYADNTNFILGMNYFY